MEMLDQPLRYKNSPDTWSLMEEDGMEDGLDISSISNLQFIEILSLLPEKEMVVIALCLFIGLNQMDIATILHCHRVTVMRAHKRMVTFLSQQSPG